jgi:hypothetical protein
MTPESFHSEASTDETYSQIGAACTVRGFFQLSLSFHPQSLPSELTSQMAQYIFIYFYSNPGLQAEALICGVCTPF